jgi:hypothetical protein
MQLQLLGPRAAYSLEMCMFLVVLAIGAWFAGKSNDDDGIPFGVAIFGIACAFGGPLLLGYLLETPVDPLTLFQAVYPDTKTSAAMSDMIKLSFRPACALAGMLSWIGIVSLSRVRFA